MRVVRAKTLLEQLISSFLMEERVIKLRHQQPSLWAGILKEDLDPLWEPWMQVADELLKDEALVDQVHEA